MKMKTIIRFFVHLFEIIISFFVDLFKREKKTKLAVVDNTLQTVPVPVIRGRNIPTHNNRRNTRGRYTQFIHMKDGSVRAIFHAPAGFAKEKESLNQ